MLNTLEYFILAVAGGVIIMVVGFIIAVRRRLKKRKAVPQKAAVKKSNAPDPTLSKADLIYPTVDVKEDDDYNYSLYQEFMKEYDPDGDKKFGTIQFRKGARKTCSFGLAEGYRYDSKGNMEWGYVRIHSGVDRARGGVVSGINDIVMAPFNFNRSHFQDFGDISYGTLTSLFNDKYQFELRIAHMHPEDDFVPWTLKQLKAKKAIKQNWYFGSAGTYGYSSGAHTHVELRSYDEECEVFEILLREKFGDKVLKEYTPAQITKFYKTQSHFKHASDSKILRDWQEQKKAKGITFCNKYLYRRTFSNGWTCTYYNTWELFGM